MICIWRTLGKMSAPAIGCIIHSLSREGKNGFCFLATESFPALYCRWYVGKPDSGISLLDASTASTWVCLETTAPLIQALLQLRGLLCNWSNDVTFMSKEFSLPKSFSPLIMNRITNVFTSHDQTFRTALFIINLLNVFTSGVWWYFHVYTALLYPLSSKFCGSKTESCLSSLSI